MEGADRRLVSSDLELVAAIVLSGGSIRGCMTGHFLFVNILTSQILTLTSMKELRSSKKYIFIK